MSHLLKTNAWHCQWNTQIKKFKQTTPLGSTPLPLLDEGLSASSDLAEYMVAPAWFLTAPPSFTISSLYPWLMDGVVMTSHSHDI